MAHVNSLDMKNESARRGRMEPRQGLSEISSFLAPATENHIYEWRDAVSDSLAVSQSPYCAKEACGAAFHQRALRWRSVPFVLADKGQKTPAAPHPTPNLPRFESDAEPTQMQNRTDERTDVCSSEVKEKQVWKKEPVKCGVFLLVGDAQQLEPDRDLC